VAASRAHRVDYDHPPSTLAVSVGDSIAVSLPQPMPSRWESTADEQALPLIADETRADAVPRGASARRILTFQVRSGAAELRLVRRRPWEREARETFVVPLQVG
jgi:hypothetical protein